MPRMAGKIWWFMTEPKLDDVDCFYPDSQLVLYYTKMVAGLEARLVIAKQKLIAAQERQKEKK